MMTTKKSDGLQRREGWGFDLELRASKDTDDSYRRLQALAIPFGVIRSQGFGDEQFVRTAFDAFFAARGKGGKGSTALQYGHFGEVVGISERAEKTADGLLMTFKVAKTAGANNALQLIEDGVIGAVSPGFWPEKVTRRGEVTVYQRAQLPHLSLEFRGAYPTALITNLRAEDATMDSDNITNKRRDSWREYRQRRDARDGVITYE